MPTEDQDQLDQNGNPISPEDQQDTRGNDDTVPAWQRALFESNQTARNAEEARQRAEAELAQLRAERQQNQNQQQPLDPNIMLQDPERFRQVLNQDMAAQVAPLNQFTREMERQQRYGRAVAELSLGQYAPIINQLRAHLDNYFLNNTSAEPTPLNILNQAKLMVADFVINQGYQQNQNQQRQQQQPQNQNQQMMPPHLRPSSRPTNQPNITNNEPNLTENERRLARESKMTPQEYVQIRDASPEDAERVYREIMKKRKEGK